jgi:Protein of unknown function (DUF2793)
MSDATAILALPLIQPAQAQKHVTHNEALRLLDVLVQLAVADRDAGTPPALPDAGACHIVGPGATGAWAGQEDRIAVFADGAWWFLAPRPGWRAAVIDEGRAVSWDGSAWQDGANAALSAATLGINATADTTNRLTVSAAATLFNHAGAGHQLKLNKATAGDTASLLYQTGFSGRAEIGLAGSDDFAVKVSPDGSAWTTAIGLNRTTGAAALATGLTVGGSLAIHRGNLLGTVSQSAGVPTGAVIERASNANGSYVRFADGTQICTHSVTLAYSSVARLTATWSFPAAFASAPRVSGTADAGDLVANTAPGPDKVGAVITGTLGTASTALWLYRISGLTNFVSGNTATVAVSAIGRWF